MKKAIITGGSYFHQNLFKELNGKYAEFFDKVIYLPTLHEQNLDSFDLVVIASRLNPHLLVAESHKILSYLEQGGNMVLLGEFPKIFLPFIRWKTCEDNFYWWIHKGADLPLYAVDSSHTIWNFLNVEDCKWHYHGTFMPGTQCCNILVNELGESILYKDAYHFKGTLYITSLDPDYHIAQGFIPKAAKFFDQFLLWVMDDIHNKAVKHPPHPPPPNPLKKKKFLRKKKKKYN